MLPLFWVLPTFWVTGSKILDTDTEFKKNESYKFILKKSECNMQRYPNKLVTLPQQIGNVTYILDVIYILGNCYRIARYRHNILKL